MGLYGMVWDGMVWYGMVWEVQLPSYSCPRLGMGLESTQLDSPRNEMQLCASS